MTRTRKTLAVLAVLGALLGAGAAATAAAGSGGGITATHYVGSPQR